MCREKKQPQHKYHYNFAGFQTNPISAVSERLVKHSNRRWIVLHLPTASSPFIHTFVAAILGGNRQPTTCCVLKYTGLQYCYVTSLLFFNHYWRTDFTTSNAKARAQLLVVGDSKRCL